MSNVKISDLPAATSFGATDVVPIVQSGVTKKVVGSLISATTTNVQTTTVSTIQEMIAANVPAGNGYITASVAANAITIAVKTLAGTDATATDVVTFVLRSATVTDGSLTAYTLSGALTTVISSGSTLGCASSDKVRIHVGAMLNASTGIELFYWTASVPSSSSIKRFDTMDLITTTAEGGAGGADSAQTAYSTTARTSQPWTYMGYIEATSGATAGQWSSIDKIVNWQPGVPMPGDIVQSQITITGAVATGTTRVAQDDTIPQQSTDGDLYVSMAITPVSTINKLEVIGKAFVSHSVSDSTIYMAVFQDSTEDAIATGGDTSGPAGGITNPSIIHMMEAGTTGSTTFKMHLGANQIGTTTLNGTLGGQLFGGTLNSYVKVSEIHA